MDASLISSFGISGAASKWKAHELWSSSYFREKLGERMVCLLFPLMLGVCHAATISSEGHTCFCIDRYCPAYEDRGGPQKAQILPLE